METTKRTSGHFSYNKAKRTMMAGLNQLGLPSFPRVLEIVSVATGRVVRFVQDDAAAERNEYWDGEMMEYYTNEADVSRVRVVLAAWVDGGTSMIGRSY